MKMNTLQSIQRPGTVSTILWHFTGGPHWNSKQQKKDRKNKSDFEALQALRGILTAQQLSLGHYEEAISVILPTYPHYDARLRKVFIKKNKRITIKTTPVCCLADIPLMHLAYHAHRYGKVAIGFHREAAIRAGFNPVFYTLESHSIIQKFYLAVAKIRNIFLDNAIDRLENTNYYLEKTLFNQLQASSVSTYSISNIIEELKNIKKEIQSIEQSISTAISFIKTFNKEEFSSIYCEREWRSTQPFKFSFQDIAFIVLPKKNNIYQKFLKEDTESLKIINNIPIIPWEDLIEH